MLINFKETVEILASHITQMLLDQSIKFISRSTCTKMNKKYIFHKLTGKRWKLKLTTYKHENICYMMMTVGIFRIRFRQSHELIC